MIPPKGRTQSTAISCAAAVSFLWALWQLCLAVLVLNVSDSMHSCPILVLRSSRAQQIGRKVTWQQGAKAFCCHELESRTAWLGMQGVGRSDGKHWLCSRWSLGKDRGIWERMEGSMWLVGSDMLLSFLKCLNRIITIMTIVNTVISL